MTIITSGEVNGNIVEVKQSNTNVYVPSSVYAISDQSSVVFIDSGKTQTVVKNDGDLISNAASGAAILDGDGDSTIINSASGSIYGNDFGIDVYGGAAGVTNAITHIENAGTISSSLEDAIGLNLAFISVLNTGTISGPTAIGSAAGATSTTALIENYGTIASTNGAGDAISVDNLSLYNYGTVTGGVNADEGGGVLNHGTIDGSVRVWTPTSGGGGVTNLGYIFGGVFLAGSGGGFFQGAGGTVNGEIVGSVGNDTFDLSHQAVLGGVLGNGGEDTIAFSTASAGMTIDLDQGFASGAGESFTFSGILDATGSGFADTITGDANNNVINAGSGDDIVNAGSGNDTINAGAGADTVMAGPGNDVVNGNGGNDILYGNGGADVIAGGAGADTMTGGAGNDTFVYSLVTDSPTTGPDLITDFVHGSDKIDLTALHLANAGDVKITSSGGLTYITIDANNDGIADMQINLTGTNVLTAGDIVGIPAAAAPAHAAIAHIAMATFAHHDLVAGLHAIAVDHGLYG